MATDGDGSMLKSDGSLNMSSDFASDTSFCEDKHSQSWNSWNDSRDMDSDNDADRLKRGRPRADQINTLMEKGALRESAIRCKICHRIFPREKSLQAHMRTHTGERPYVCDYPDCAKAFCQSGQLKTHQRLHTGEKPFVCNVPNCESRFTHANRHCADHPTAGLRREDAHTQILQLIKADTRPEVAQWLKRQAQLRLKTPNKPDHGTKAMSSTTKRSLSDDMENVWSSHKRMRLPAVSESPPQTEIPSAQDTLNSSHEFVVNSVFTTPAELNAAKCDTSSDNAVAEQNVTESGLVQNRTDNEANTVTVQTSVAVREKSVIQHTIQVRKDHQLPIQRLLKPEEYEAIRSSPRRRFPLSPIKPSSVPRRIPFSPLRNGNQSQKENCALVLKSKAQVALFASPPPKSRTSPEDSPARTVFSSPRFTASTALPYNMTSTPTRMSPRKFAIPSNSTPIRNSPKKHQFTSPAQLKRVTCSPKKYHLYTTPSPVSSYRIQSPRKSNLFASRLSSRSSPVKRTSPVKLFSSPSNIKSFRQQQLQESPRKPMSPRRRPAQILLSSPLKKAGESSDKLMGALALMELAGGL